MLFQYSLAFMAGYKEGYAKKSLKVSEGTLL